ncbi:matrix metallopeptidase 28 (epilysin), isoform CRA_b [Mus musculus]|nr:matrix metallopeptidase 28 (epilysin), isoform CRA_b [Mus musculus]
MCLRPLYKRRQGCCMVRRADGPLSPRHSWRSMDTSVSRAPKPQPPHSSGTPSESSSGYPSCPSVVCWTRPHCAR